jgi:hypothetical protein
MFFDYDRVMEFDLELLSNKVWVTPWLDYNLGLCCVINKVSINCAWITKKRFDVVDFVTF